MLTLAQMEAAETTGNLASAFSLTVILTSGNRYSNLRW